MLFRSTAGRGVAHSERTPGYLRDAGKTFHGLQIWVALPKEMEQAGPAFSHIPAGDIPVWEQDGAAFKLIAGEAFGRKSPMPVYSCMHLVEVKTKDAATVNPGSILHGENAIYIVEGGIQIGEAHYDHKKMVVLEEGSAVRFEMERNTLVYLLGGEPFPEERYIWWNFVSSGKELIEQAKTDWKEQRFPEIPGETEFVPLPL